MSVITTTMLLMSPCSSRMGLRLIENCPAAPFPRNAGISRLIDRASLKRSVESLLENGASRRRDHFHQRMPQQILFPISRFEAAAIGVADELCRVEHENHALRVVQNVAIEISLAAITPLGLAAIRDVLQDVNRSYVVFFGSVNARSRNKVRSIAGRVHELFVRRLRTCGRKGSAPVEWANREAPICRCLFPPIRRDAFPAKRRAPGSGAVPARPCRGRQ